jgi:hypothetical protein
MPASKIMIVRHAEKPTEPGETPEIDGVSADGQQDPEELIVRGWQRSGGLVRLFAPRDGHFVDPHLALPGTIFASGVAHHSKSLRPQHTVLELANVLGLQLSTQFIKDDYDPMADAAVATNGIVLIAWEHQFIPAIGNRIVGNSTTVPQTWPGNRFDVVWVFDRQGAGWAFSQVPQLLLSGDSATPIPN